MSDFYDWFAGLATLGGFAYFMLGFAVSYAFWWWRCKKLHENLRVPWHYVGIVVGLFMIIVTSIQSSEAYNTAKNVAEQQRACNIQFRKAIVDRSKISKENDELSQEQRLIVFMWFHDILFPPPPYDVMSTDDPLRRQFVLQRTLQTEDKFKQSINRQDKVQEERDRHTYPDPTCGN